MFVVIGAGTMGTGIAYVAASAGYQVRLVEVDPARREAALAELDRLWAGAVARERLTAEEAAAARTHVGVAGSVPDGAEVVIEARLGVALGLEAIRMVEDGVAEAADIDRAMVLGYRHPVGPLELTDLVGLDVRLDIARTLAVAYGPRFEPPRLLVSLVEAGRLGRKVGHGFYRWQDGRVLHHGRGDH